VLKMIDFGKKVQGKEQKSYDDLPVGRYTVTVKTVDDWEVKSVKNARVIVRDEDGAMLKDEKGKIKREIIPLLEYATAKVKLEVVEGEHAGRLIFTSLSTHPDALFVMEGFLFAIDKSEVTLGDVKKECEGEMLDVELNYRIYEKENVDQATGLTTTESKKVQDVKKFYHTLF